MSAVIYTLKIILFPKIIFHGPMERLKYKYYQFICDFT